MLELKENQTYPIECPECDGFGRIMNSSPAANAFDMPECEHCGGTGSIEMYYDDAGGYSADVEERILDNIEGRTNYSRF